MFGSTCIFVLKTGLRSGNQETKYVAFEMDTSWNYVTTGCDIYNNALSFYVSYNIIYNIVMAKYVT